jgi:hypothetical protein
MGRHLAAPAARAMDILAADNGRVTVTGTVDPPEAAGPGCQWPEPVASQSLSGSVAPCSS